jgi:hypothetical protein
VARRLTEEEYLRMEYPGGAAALFNSRTPLRTSTRKVRLYLCACCRRVWDWLGTDANRAAVEAAERAADGLMRIMDLRPYYEATSYVSAPLRRYSNARCNPARDAAWPFAWPTGTSTHGATWLAGCHRAGEQADESAQDAVMKAEMAAQCALIHDLLGNPFRPVAVDPAWLSPAAVRIAQAAYDERELPSGELTRDRLAVLSDALEDAGCTDAVILSHLRSPGPHVRGCWVIDRIIGRG